MRKLLPFLLIILLISFSSKAYSDYSTPGTGVSWTLTDLVSNSSGVVTFSGGEYYLNDTLVISASDTIKVTSNGNFKFAGNTMIDIFGVFRITPPDSFKITAADTNQKFLGLKFEEFSDPSILKKVIMEYGNAIRLLNSDMIIDSCIIRYNTQNSSFGSGAIALFQSNPMISNNIIYRNRRAAIQSGANISSAPKIINNLIYENDTDNGNYPQINFGATGTDTILIKNNIIRGGPFPMAGGIAFLPIGNANIRIEGNTITHNRYGIALASANTFAIIDNNRIDSNNIDNNPNTGGSGLNFNGNSTIVAICTNNAIRGNLWGVTIQGTAKPNLGNLTTPTPFDDGANHIYGNGNSGQIYDLYNNTPDSIKAENNNWGTIDFDSVEAHIFHKPDNASLGFVDYLPIAPPVNIQEIGSNKNIQSYYLHDSYPNPFNPISTIVFEIPVVSFVKVRVFDMIGREIDNLVNQQLSQGSYKIQWNASRHPSGIYFVRLEANGLVLSKKLVLSK
ncbi:MAG: right-handed parallel beta-helix repeat-containing protein [Ignavibacteriae bacterium]|nr:right-handed parallel beta-helix repeat-containing protein [Ignavibacteriota bacterium]MCB9243158.1 right-handed parallel beta-helix repeat-containing protein [Ignavibacteriales bacterium]